MMKYFTGKYDGIKYVVEGEHGYWDVIVADSEGDAMRSASNLAWNARLEYANAFVIGIKDYDVSADEFYWHNCDLAMSYGARCECGMHE